MKYILFLLLATSALSQTVGQFELRKRTSTGFTSYGLTSEDGKAIGFTAGAPAMLTLSGGAWGSITGTLSAQTDLNTALGLKAALADPTFTGAVSLGSSAQSSSSFTVINNGSTSASLVLKSGDGTYNSKIRPVSTLTGLRTVTLPDASGTVLFTDGSGASLTGITPSQLAQASATSGQVLTWSGTAWAPATATGGVTSVTGTANQITVTGTTTPTLSLPATITGLTSVTSTTFVGGLTGLASLNLPLAGGTLTGALTVNAAITSTTAGRVGDISLGVFAGGGSTIQSLSGALVLDGPGGYGNVSIGPAGANMVCWPQYGYTQCRLGGYYAWSASTGSGSGSLSTRIVSNRANHVELGLQHASSWASQTLSPAGAEVATTTNGSPSNNLVLTNAVSTGTGTSTGRIIISTYGTNGASGTAIGTLTERAAVSSAGLSVGANGTSTATLKHGTATLTAGTVTVSDSNILTTSRIFINRQTDGGTLGDSYSITRSAGVSFTITSKTANTTVSGDTSIISYLIINP